MLLLLASFAHAGTLGVSTRVDAVMYVDGRPIDARPGSGPAWLELDATGTHLVEARTSSNRPIAALSVVTPDGVELVVEYQDRQFAVTSVRATPGARAQVGPPGTPTTIIVDVNGAPPRPPRLPEEEKPAPKPVAARYDPVSVELLPLDGQWANVWIDGEKVGEFRVNAPKKVITLAAGRHKVVVQDFMDNEVYASGYLELGAVSPVRIGFDDDGVEVYNDPKAWSSR